MENIKKLRIHNWRGKIQDGKSWKRIKKEAKTSEEENVKQLIAN